MRSDKSLWGSISILIGCVIAVLALAKGPLLTGLLIGIFTVWSIWVVASLLLPYMQQAKRRRIRQRQMKTLQAESIAPTITMPETGNEAMDSLLLRHVNHRISAYLKAAYPDVRWEWCEKNPERLICHGGTGRIRIFGVADFDHADIKLDQQAHIACDMIRIVPLASVNGNPEEKTPSNKQPVDPQIWYEMQGRKVLESLVADLCSRGHSSLTLHEDGDVCIIEDKDEVAKEHLSGFPEKVYWPRLVQVFERNGLAAEITAKGIQISW